MLRSLILLFACSSIAACGSTGTSEYSKADITGIPMTIKYVDYRNNIVCRLVNDSHSDRLATYSEERSEAGTKIASDEIVAVTIERMLEQNFEAHSLRGLAPLRSNEYTSALEIDDPAGVRYIALTPRSSVPEFNIMQDCRTTFLTVYSNVYGAQRVSNPDGASLFYDNRDKLHQDNTGKLNR